MHKAGPWVKQNYTKDNLNIHQQEIKWIVGFLVQQNII